MISHIGVEPISIVVLATIALPIELIGYNGKPVRVLRHGNFFDAAICQFSKIGNHSKIPHTKSYRDDSCEDKIRKLNTSNSRLNNENTKNQSSTPKTKLCWNLILA